MALPPRPKRIFLLNPTLPVSSPSPPPLLPAPSRSMDPTGFGLARLFEPTTKASGGDSQKIGTGAYGGAVDGVGLRKVETAEADELIDFVRHIGGSDEEVKGVGVYRNELQKKIEVLRGEDGGSKDGVVKRKVREGKGKRVKGLERVDWNEELGGLEENGDGDGSVGLKGMKIIGEGDWDEELGEVVVVEEEKGAEV